MVYKVLDPQLSEFNCKNGWSFWCFNSINTLIGAQENEFLVIQHRGIIALWPKMSYLLMLRKWKHHELHIHLLFSNEWMYIAQISVKWCLHMSSTICTIIFLISLLYLSFYVTALQRKQIFQYFLQHRSTFTYKQAGVYRSNFPISLC